MTLLFSMRTPGGCATRMPRQQWRRLAASVHSVDRLYGAPRRQDHLLPLRIHNASLDHLHVPALQQQAE